MTEIDKIYKIINEIETENSNTRVGKLLKNLKMQLSFATERDNVKQEIRNIFKPILNHLVKIIIWGNKTQNLSGWCDDVAKWLDELLNLEYQNKKISRKVYVEGLEQKLDIIFNHDKFTKFFKREINRLQNKRSKPFPTPKKYDLDKVWNIFHTYLDDIFLYLQSLNDSEYDMFFELTYKLGQ